MAFDVYLRVAFDDAGPFRNIKEYLLVQTLAVDGSDMADVLTAATDVQVILDSLSMDHIAYYDIVVRVPQAGAAANVAANNGVEAFHRMLDSVTGKHAHFIVPAWDDVIYDKNPDTSMSTAYNEAADDLAPLTRNPATGNAWTYVAAQSRTTKRGQRQYKP
jgi:hypothetical protein